MKDTSGPAFPVIAGAYVKEGLTKREEFAKVAMVAWRIAAPASKSEDLARFAKQDAIALIAELEKE